MSKKLRRIVLGLALIATTTTFIACGAAEKKEEEPKVEPEQTIKEGFSYVYDDGKEKIDVKVIEKPEKAVTLSQFMTEMLLALDLGDRMVGTALLDNPILPEFKEAYNKIPVLKIKEGHNISKEAFTALNSDFVSGWEMSISDETTGTPSELVKGGGYPFVAKSLSGTATIETVYEDILEVGKIFDVEERAKLVVKGMKDEIIGVQKSLEKQPEVNKARVMIYDSGKSEAKVVGAGLPNNLIELAGGKNVYGDLTKPYEMVSLESIVEKNPDTILVTEFSTGEKAEDKIKFLKSHPVLKEVSAIKYNNIHVVKLADISPGVRNSKVILEMNKAFYRRK